MNTYDLKRVIRTSFLGRSKFYLALRYYLKRGQIDLVIKKYLGDNVTSEKRRQIKKKMLHVMMDYRWDFDEYFIFHYEEYDDEKRRSFVPEFDKNVFCDIVNDKKQADMFLDKWTTYKYFKEFFGRDVYNIRNLEDLEKDDFIQFVNNHPSFIMKPVFGTRGVGIQVFQTNNAIEAKKILTHIYNSGIYAFILEELIVQHEKLAVLHPKSLNTLRVNTFRFGDRIEVIYPFLRIGRGDSVVDNAGAGGVMGLVDVETGKIIAAADEFGNRYEKHPDSDINLIGFEIPCWEEVIQFVTRVAQVLPGVRYVGWDVAITNKGCVLVEGNDKAQFVFQIPQQEGFRCKMNSILRGLGKKEIN